MTQLPATLPQQGASLGKQRVPAPPGGQLMAGPRGAGSDVASGQDGASEDALQFVVPDRPATPLLAVPANVTKPIAPAILPEIGQLPVDDDELVTAPVMLEPRNMSGGADLTLEAVAIPGRSVALSLGAQPTGGRESSIGGQTPVARVQSAMAPLADAGRQSNNVEAKPVIPSAAQPATVQKLENHGRSDLQLGRVAGTGPDKAPGAPVNTARFQSMLSARVDSRRQAQSSPPVDAKTASVADAKLETVQTGRPEIKVTVMHQETHLGSAQLQDMQSADGRAGRSGAVVQPGQPAAVPAELARSQPAPMRVLHLHLEPAELGGVVVKMNTKGGALTVQIQPQLPQTALMLRSDSAALNSILQAAGVLADNATVQITDPSGNSNASGNGAWASNQDADQSGSAQRGKADAGEGQRSGTGKEHDDAGQGVQDEQGDFGLSGARSELYL